MVFEHGRCNVNKQLMVACEDLLERTSDWSSKSNKRCSCCLGCACQSDGGEGWFYYSCIWEGWEGEGYIFTLATYKNWVTVHDHLSACLSLFWWLITCISEPKWCTKLVKASGPSRVWTIVGFRVWWRLEGLNTIYHLLRQCPVMLGKCLFVVGRGLRSCLLQVHKKWKIENEKTTQPLIRNMMEHWVSQQKPGHCWTTSPTLLLQSISRRRHPGSYAPWSCRGCQVAFWAQSCCCICQNSTGILE